MFGFPNKLIFRCKKTLKILFKKLKFFNFVSDKDIDDEFKQKQDMTLILTL